MVPVILFLLALPGCKHGLTGRWQGMRDGDKTILDFDSGDHVIRYEVWRRDGEHIRETLPYSIHKGIVECTPLFYYPAGIWHHGDGSIQFHPLYPDHKLHEDIRTIFLIRFKKVQAD